MSTLIKDIENYKSSFIKKVPDDIQAIMSNSTQKLIHKELSKQALRENDLIPEFTLLNTTNQLIHINDVLDKHDYVVLSFYRGSWCPYCNLELKHLEKIQASLKILHTELIAISPQTNEQSLQAKEKLNLSFDILCDKNNAVAKKFGLVFSLDDELRPIYENFGIDILKSNKNGTFDLPMPATYVINKNHKIIYSFIDEDYTKRCEPNDILHAIKDDIKNLH